MRFLALICLTLGWAALSQGQYVSRLFVPHHVDPVSDEMAHHINNLNTTWKAQNNFRGYTRADLKRLMGTRLNNPNPLPLKKRTGLLNAVPIPDSFDAREQWPECASIIGHIRDQGSCGSCWANGAAEVISDRTCISSGGKIKLLLSVEDILSCCGFSCGDGCDGGYPDAALSYWVKSGVVTGGDFGDTTTCQSYEIPPCEHHTTGPRPSCTGEGNTPTCVKKCQSSYNGTWTQDKHFGKEAYSVGSSEDDIKRELLSGGSVEAAFSVYDDFPSYKSGVYQTHSQNFLGGHAVKILGWGTENGTPYWLVANSWNNDWGLQGYFKIIRGQNECGIEEAIVAGTPK